MQNPIDKKQTVRGSFIQFAIGQDLIIWSKVHDFVRALNTCSMGQDHTHFSFKDNDFEFYPIKQFSIYKA